MARVDQLYDWLVQEADPEVDRVFAAAVERAESPYFERIVRILIARDEPASWAALAGVYGKLSPEFQDELTRDKERLRIAISGAARLPSSAARLQAMQLLRKFPFPQLAYVVSDALRDTYRPVSELAAHQLLVIAEQFIKRHGSNGAMDPDEAENPVKFARQQLISALADALRSYHLHWRLEPVQAALWFAHDLGTALWEPLNQLRSRLREAVLEHMRSWDDPKLAPFLLLGLKQKEWHSTAAAQLSQWSSRSQLEALLDHSYMLNDAEFCESLRKVREPNWFDQVDRFLNDLSTDHRRALPRWIFAVGLTVNERTNLLARFLHRSCPVLRRACVYAMAALEVAEVSRRIQQIGTSDAVLSAFARWWSIGRELNLGLDRVPRARIHNSDTRRAASRRRQTDDQTFDMIWQICSRIPIRDAGGLLTLMREHMDFWGSSAVKKLRAASPRERIFALHVLGTHTLASHYKQDIQRLLSDPVASIRDLARHLLQSVARLETRGRLAVAHGYFPQSNRKHQDSTAQNTQPLPTRSFEEIRGDLMSYLNALQSEAARVAVTAEGVAALNAMLAEYRAVRFSEEANQEAGVGEES
jgi:hypothetical protein